MRRSSTTWIGSVVLSGLLMIACSSTGPTSTKLTNTWVDQAHRDQPVSDILVIGVSNDEGIRRSFETNFVANLRASGVEAVSSANVIAIPADEKIAKEVIVRVVKEQNNDAVVITHLVAVDEKRVDVPPPAQPQRSAGLFGGYSMAYAYTHQAGYRVDKTVHLETNLYDAKTEKLIWSGQSETWNRSDQQLIDEVIEVVVKDWKKKGLLAPK